MLALIRGTILLLKSMMESFFDELQVQKRRFTDPPQYCAYGESPVYEGVANKLGYKPKQGRWHF